MVQALYRIVTHEDFSREPESVPQSQELEEIQKEGALLDADFQFHYPLSYVVKTWYQFKERNVYPRGGGYDDQDDLLMQDWEWLDRAYAHLQKEYEYDKKYPPFANTGEADTLTKDMIRGMG